MALFGSSHDPFVVVVFGEGWSVDAVHQAMYDWLCMFEPEALSDALVVAQNALGGPPPVGQLRVRLCDDGSCPHHQHVGAVCVVCSHPAHAAADRLRMAAPPGSDP